MVNQERLQRAQERMRVHHIDAYMIINHGDFIYFFGVDRNQPRAIIPAEGEPVIVAFTGEEEELRQALSTDKVRIFSTVGQKIKDVVSEMNRIRGDREGMTVGFHMGWDTPAFLLNLFQQVNPKVKVVDIAPVMDELHMIKDDGEVALIRKACQIGGVGMQAAKNALRPGISEIEICAEIEYAMRKAGGYGTATPLYVNSGIHSGWLHGGATERRLEIGDLVVVNLTPRYRGYVGNLCRTFVVGAPSERQKAIMDTHLRARDAAVQALKPGKLNRDVDAAAKAVYEQAGFGELFVPGFSHGIGLEFEEKPRPTLIPPDQNVEIRAGMVLTAGHSVLSVPGVGGARFEDTYFITPEGAVPLTNFSD